MDVRAAVEEHARWIVESARHPDSWAATASRYGLHGVGAGPGGARSAMEVVCGWYLPHAPDDATREWLAGAPAAVAAAVEPPRAVSSIFANARRTARQTPWAGVDFDLRVSVGCPGCGAAQERPRDFRCRYCGGDLFPARPEDA